MIFIIGVGRSGTSLLQVMLNSHSRIAFLPEINYIRRFLATNRLENIRKRKGVEGLRGFLLEDRWLRRLPLSLDDVLDKVDFDAAPISLSVYRRIIEEYLQHEGKDVPGDKDPRSIEYIPTIHNRFPDAHVIHMIRDPRDVLLSKTKADWSRHRSYHWHVFANRVQLELGIRDSSLFGDRYMEVRYERLVRDPETVLGEICHAIGLDFEEEMLDFSESSKRLVAEEEIQWKGKTFGPLVDTNVGKWKEELTDWQVSISEEIVIPAFEQYGYAKSTRRHGPVKTVLLALLRLLYSAGAKGYLIMKKRSR